MTNVQQQLLKAHVARALSAESGRRPTEAELRLHLRVLTRALTALRRAYREVQEQRSSGHAEQETHGGVPC
jgi:hypothetical protein